MRLLLLVLLVGTLNATEIGEISELSGNGEVSRQDSGDYLIAQLASDIFSFDEVRTGKGRMAVEFLDSSVLKLTEHSKVIIDNYIFDPDPSKRNDIVSCAKAKGRSLSDTYRKPILSERLE